MKAKRDDGMGRGGGREGKDGKKRVKKCAVFELGTSRVRGKDDEGRGRRATKGEEGKEKKMEEEMEKVRKGLW